PLHLSQKRALNHLRIGSHQGVPLRTPPRLIARIARTPLPIRQRHGHASVARTSYEHTKSWKPLGVGGLHSSSIDARFTPPPSCRPPLDRAVRRCTIAAIAIDRCP